MKREEYLWSDLPDEVREAYEQAPSFLKGINTNTVGFTLGGVRYRVYRDKKTMEAASPVADLIDAGRGADIPAARLASSMDELGIDAQGQGKILAMLAKLKAKKRAGSRKSGR